MKFGLRTPSLSKRISARTTGAMKRKIKREIIPGYGKKGMGLIKDPERSVYNKVYHKTTTGCVLPCILLLLLLYALI